MPLNLVELIKASGNAGVAGQSFRGHVTASADNVKMTDYRITSVTYFGAPAPFPAYVDNPQIFLFDADITRGSLAHLIQRNTSDAWLAELDTAPAGASVSFTNFVSLGSPNGATHEFDIYVIPPYNGTPAPSVTGNLLGDNTPEFTANIGTTSGGGTSTLTLRLTYDPDNAAFNPSLSASWNFDINNRGYAMSDFEVRWYNSSSNRSSDTNRLETGPYYNDPTPLNVFESFTAYVRYVRIADGATYDTEATVTRNF